jgi:hypothetical protein
MRARSILPPSDFTAAHSAGFATENSTRKSSASSRNARHSTAVRAEVASRAPERPCAAALRRFVEGLSLPMGLARRVLDERQDTARHESGPANRLAGAGHLSDLNYAAAGCDLDPATGACGDDLIHIPRTRLASARNIAGEPERRRPARWRPICNSASGRGNAHRHGSGRVGVSPEFCAQRPPFAAAMLLQVRAGPAR